MQQSIHLIILFGTLIGQLLALQCTTNCSYTVRLDVPFYVKNDCTEMVSAGSCFAQTTIWYDRDYYVVQFGAYESSYIMDDRYHAMAQLSDDSSIAMSYSLKHSCKGTDDCAKLIAKDQMSAFVQRPRVNYISLLRQLSPLLTGSETTTELVCFNEKENIRQCAIPKIRGVCELDHDLKKNKIKRNCDHELAGSTRHVSVYQSGKYASFSLKCDRSFCNGHLTLEAVKRVMFEHRITATLEGRLSGGSMLIASLGCCLVSMIFVLFSQ